jgi:hypothetical protein
MELFTLESGPKMDLDMGKGYKFGRMVRNMRATGKTTWPTAKDD